jgi:hypothetical protein
VAEAVRGVEERAALRVRELDFDGATDLIVCFLYGFSNITNASKAPRHFSIELG